MQCRELGRRHPFTAAMRPDLIEVLPPSGNDGSSLWQGLKPMIVQALVTELAVETFDIAVLRRPAWFDQVMANAM